MKLSNQQVGAILHVLEEQHKEKSKKEQAEELKRSEKSVDKEAERLLKIYQTIPPELVKIIKGMYSHEQMNKARIIKSLVKGRSIPAFNRQSMKSKIILMSIDAKTIEELQSKLKLKL